MVFIDRFSTYYEEKYVCMSLRHSIRNLICCINIYFILNHKIISNT